MNTNKKQKIIDKWIEDNGSAGFDLKNKDILLDDGGLFYIQNKPKIKEWKKGFLKRVIK